MRILKAIILIVKIILQFFFGRLFINPYMEGRRGTDTNKVRRNTLKLNSKPLDSKKKGDLFEVFITKKIDQKTHKLKEWRSDKYVDGIYAEANMNPDLEVEFVTEGKKIRVAIECKYRSYTNNGFIEIAKERQLINYNHFARERGIDVYVALGLGGAPNNPAELFIIPVETINNPTVHINSIKQYKRFPGLMLYYDLRQGRLM